jgi:transposase
VPYGVVLSPRTECCIRCNSAPFKLGAHHQLPGGNIVLIWDNLNVHLRAELRAFTTAQPWLEVFQLPSYAPDLNPVEGIWSSLKRGPLANRAFTGPAHLLQVIRHALRKIQHRPGLIEGCLAATGLSLEPDRTV